MPFPAFEPTTPVFIRTLAETFKQRELIVLNGQRLTYEEADRQSAQLAKGLLVAGVSKSTRVGMLMPNGPDFVIAWLALARIGALIIPINTFYKPKELLYVLHHADIEILLMVPRLLSNDYLERLEICAPSLVSVMSKGKSPVQPLLLPELPFLRRVYVFDNDHCGKQNIPPWAKSIAALFQAAEHSSMIDDTFLAAVERCVTPADPLVIIYSSGSTSDPKGAVHTQGTIIRHAYNLNHWRDITEHDRIFSPMPFFWVGGLIFTLHCAMHRGACIICEEGFEPGATLALIEQERATVVTGWPHYGKAMIDHASFKQRDLSAVRSGNIYAILPEECRPADPELRSNALGMTETCGPHCIDHMDVDLPESLRGAFGRAVEGVEHKIIDPESGVILPAGEQGELCIRGYNVMQGLYKVEREDTFDVDGFYRTGDSGYLNEEGFLFFKARLGDMIKTGGANVTPREVEVAIDAQPEVQGSYVVGLPHPDRGQTVVAAVVLNKNEQLASEVLRGRLREELSSYKIPKKIFFFEKENLPFTDSGKIDKRKLSQLLVDMGD